MFTNYQDLSKLLLFTVFISLFLLMVYSPDKIAFLNNKVLNTIGISSYFLYLIHENAGVFLIHKNNIDLGLPFLAPLLYILILIIFSVFFTTYVEGKMISALKRLHKF